MELTAPTANAAKGATLLELLVYVGIIGLVLTTAVSFLAEYTATQSRALAYAETVRNARFAVSRIAAEVRQATAINTGTSTFGANPSTLSLDVTAAAADPTVFDVADGVLRVKQGADPALSLTSAKTEVVDFTVDDVSVSGKTKAVRIRLRLRNRNTSNLIEQQAETTVETTARIHVGDGFGS